MSTEWDQHVCFSRIICGPVIGNFQLQRVFASIVPRQFGHQDAQCFSLAFKRSIFDCEIRKDKYGSVFPYKP